MEQQRLLLYVALAFFGLLLWQQWQMDYGPKPVPTTVEGAAAETAPSLVSGGEALMPDAAVVTANQAALQAPTIRVRTDVLDLDISTVGGTITRLELPTYPVSVDQPNVPYTLLSGDSARFMQAESGLRSRQGVPAPTHLEPMQAAASEYVLGDDFDELKVPLTWTSDSGITVTKTYTFRRDSFAVDLDYVIENGSSEPWYANQYRQIKRNDSNRESKQFSNTYTGAVISSTEERYEKVNFKDIAKGNYEADVTGGWIAMIQHYFATAWLTEEGESVTAYTQYQAGNDLYVVGMVSSTQTIPAGSTGTFSSKAYIGPKIQDRMKAVAEHLELTVDYGWLTILAQPLFWLLKTIHGFVGNWGWSIILVTLIVKAAFYKLSESSYRSMARMKLLQPKLQQLKDRYGDDRAKMGQATMELYKKEKVNPLGGCLPMLVQIPVFIALYWVLLESVELRQAPWVGWIQDLSIRDPFFVLPVLMAISMFIQQKLNPAPVDPIQQKVFMALPFVFGFFFATFPAGLVLYWVVSNIISIAQQYYITRHVLVEKTAKA